MSKKKSPLKDLFNAVSLSEPLKTFKSNIEAIDALPGISLYAIRRHKDAVEQMLAEDTQLKGDAERSLRASKDRLKQSYKMRKEVGGWKRWAGAKKGQLDRYEDVIIRIKDMIKSERTLISQRKRNIDRWSLLCRNYSALISRYDKQREMLIPMVFVYLVAIWDAFIFDTVRRILKVHPQLIWTRDAKIEFSKSVLWNANNIEEVRDYLIEHTVRQLESDRRVLVSSFRDYWGIDWEKSGIPLDKIIEIRARRDIWVHNKGKVNQQYLNTVKEGASYKAGQLAEITEEYFHDSTIMLTELAVYVHNIAHKKHYAGTD